MGIDDDGDVFVYQWNWNGCDGPVDDPLLGHIMSTGDSLNGASKNRENRKHIPKISEEEKSGIFFSNRAMYQWGTNIVTL